MNQYELFRSIFSAMVNQALINKNNMHDPLPPDQEEALKRILDALHDLNENKAKIKPEYQSQVIDTIVLKIASEIGWFNGGIR